MQYRPFPKLPGEPASILGFGAMRLPVRDGSPALIDEEVATGMLHHAIEHGVSYVDTAWPYHAGESEPFLGRALRGPWRGRVQLATKHPVWLVEAEADWERYLDRQLERLQTDHLDVYLLHALDGKRWETVRRLRGIEAMERARADGRIRHLGFSFHGPLEEFKRIVDGYDGWELCQIQLNYLDRGYQAGIEGLGYAAARDIGVVVMEPLRGGALARVPEPVQQILARAAGPRLSPAARALRWLWNLPEVVTVLSGMGSERELQDNLGAAEGATVAMAADELACIEEARAFFDARLRVPCTTCGYCQPCPEKVAIADVLSLMNAAFMFGGETDAKSAYKAFFLDAGQGADRCTKCRECEPRCPQSIAIPDRLEEAHAGLTG